jgi:hypothetical protein
MARALSSLKEGMKQLLSPFPDSFISPGKTEHNHLLHHSWADQGGRYLSRRHLHHHLNLEGVEHPMNNLDHIKGDMAVRQTVLGLQIASA